MESVLAQQVEGGLTCIWWMTAAPTKAVRFLRRLGRKGRPGDGHPPGRFRCFGCARSGLAAATVSLSSFLDSDDALRPRACRQPLTAQRAAPQDFVVWHYHRCKKTRRRDCRCGAAPPRQALPGCGWTACWLCPGTSRTGPTWPSNCSLMCSTRGEVLQLCWITSPCWGRRCRVRLPGDHQPLTFMIAAAAGRSRRGTTPTTAIFAGNTLPAERRLPCRRLPDRGHAPLTPRRVAGVCRGAWPTSCGAIPPHPAAERLQGRGPLRSPWLRALLERMKIEHCYSAYYLPLPLA